MHLRVSSNTQQTTILSLRPAAEKAIARLPSPEGRTDISHPLSWHRGTMTPVAFFGGISWDAHGLDWFILSRSGAYTFAQHVTCDH